MRAGTKSRFPPGHPSRGGRPFGPNPIVLHRSRTVPKGGGPHAVTLKVRPGIALGGPAVAREVAKAFADGTERGRFRLAGWSLEGDHVHLRVAAEDADELGCAMKSVAALFAFAVNRALARRTGKVIAERYRIVAPARRGEARLPCGCPPKPTGAPRRGPRARPR
jgi:hypothetical protein